MFSIVVALIYIPIHSILGFPFSAFSSIVICRHFDDSHFDRGEVVPHSGFDLHFSEDYQCWAFFHVPVGHLNTFFIKIYIQDFCPFFKIYLLAFLILRRMNCLYILDIHSYWSYNLQIFSSVGCLFILLLVSFIMHNLLILVRSHLLIWVLFPYP